MKYKRKGALKKVLCLVFVVSFLLTGCGKEDENKKHYVLTTGFERDEVMRINNMSCFMPEMMLYLTTIQNEYASVYSEEVWNKDINGESLSDKIKEMVLAKIAKIKVMNLMAQSYGISLEDNELQRIEGAATTFYASLNDKEKELIGVSLEDVKKMYSEYAMADKVYNYIIKDIDAEISDDEARTITVMMIQIKTYGLDSDGRIVEYTNAGVADAYKRAQELYEILTDEEAPQDFESVAARYNESEKITYSFGRGQVEKVIEDAAFSLDEGQISPIVSNKDGYYIIKCVSVFDIDQTQANKAKILEERKSKLFSDTYEAFIANLTKNLNRSLVDSIELIDDPEVTTSSFFDITF
ncbi:MAG: peptidylprolyl isomerase [Lachnospiraceae bacterium]|nr:peptidylprolyl isomerase [Lachnospiraceae bacterium]